MKKQILIIIFTTLILNISAQPAQHNMQAALDYIKSESGADGNSELIIWQDGKILFQGDSTVKQHNIFSCTKSFTSTIVGLLVHEGVIKLDDKIITYNPEVGEKYKNVSFRHLITMTSGYNASGANKWGEPSADWSVTPYLPDEPLFEPGNSFAYWDEAMMLLSKTLTIIIKKPLKDYLNEKIMLPLGIHNWSWWGEHMLDSIPINNGCTGINISATDLLKVGILFLHNGKHNNKQLIPKKWVKAATKNQVGKKVTLAKTDRAAFNGVGCYGFNWWTNTLQTHMPNTPKDAYYMSGLNHNVCFVIPKWKMVVVRLGQDGNPKKGKPVVWNNFFKLLNTGL
jgi:CubicO group peptidase (beta-lactamase class C family)